MKTRNGFVSNSSTTSFTIFGISLEPDEAKKMLKWNHPKVKELCEKYEYKEGEELRVLGALLSNLVESPEYGDHLYFGRSWSSVKDDETGAQFKERVRATLAEFLTGELELSTYEEAWYDG